MRHAAFAVLSSCVVAFTALLVGPALAGDYSRYDGGYDSPRPYRGNEHVWYSSSCCYRRVVRHAAHYEQIDRYGYYDRPRHSGYYGRHYGYGPYERSYRYSDYPYYRSRTVSNWRDASGDESCHWRRTQVFDGRGGWVWGTRRVCD